MSVRWRGKAILVRAEGKTTRLLQRVSEGNDSAADQLFPLVYEELRRVARNLFRHERPGHTLQPTAVVHEAYARLIQTGGRTWESRAHFLAIAAKAMRRILVDHARKKATKKRGADWNKIPLDDALAAAEIRDQDLLALSDAAESLAENDPRKARVVELRIFGGMTVKETAHVLHVSDTTVESDWRFARAWLSKRLREDDPD